MTEAEYVESCLRTDDEWGEVITDSEQQQPAASNNWLTSGLGNSPADPPAATPQNATAEEFRKEFYAAGGEHGLGVSEDQYVRSCLASAAGGEIL